MTEPVPITAATLLTAVDQAILTILQHPQSFVSIDGRQYSYQDLGKLRQLRAELRKEVADSGTVGTTGANGAGSARPFASGFSVSSSDF